MLIVLESSEAFVTPRTKFEIDLDGIAKRLEGSPASKGMFFNRALGLCEGRADEDEVIRAAGLEVQRFVPFNSYPWMDFLRLCCAVSDVVFEGRHAVGLRHIGRTLYSEFADSLAGKVTFGLLRNNADRVIALGPKAWNMSGIPGQVLGESMGDCHYRYHFIDYPAVVAETLGVGAVEGALAECHESPRVLIGTADPMNSILDIRWGDHSSVGPSSGPSSGPNSGPNSG